MKFKIKHPVTFKVLDISTGHITEADGKLLTNKAHGTEPVHNTDMNSPIIYDYGEGAFVYCAADEYYAAFSKAFNRILKFARCRGCRYVCFDADAETYKHLKLYDW